MKMEDFQQYLDLDYVTLMDINNKYKLNLSISKTIYENVK